MDIQEVRTRIKEIKSFLSQAQAKLDDLSMRIEADNVLEPTIELKRVTVKYWEDYVDAIQHLNRIDNRQFQHKSARDEAFVNYKALRMEGYLASDIIDVLDYMVNVEAKRGGHYSCKDNRTPASLMRQSKFAARLVNARSKTDMTSNKPEDYD